MLLHKKLLYQTREPDDCNSNRFVSDDSGREREGGKDGAIKRQRRTAMMTTYDQKDC